MSQHSIPEMAAEIAEQFADTDVDVDDQRAQADLETLIEEYSVPAGEAKRTVRNKYRDEAGLEREELFTAPENDQVSVDDIDTAEEWVDLEVQVADLWADTHDSMAQAGLLGDESGTIKFISWEASELPPLQEGESYRLEGVVTDEYEGRYSVKLVSTTEIRRIDEEVEVGDDAISKAGALVDIKSGSGLIKRCPVEDCTRVTQNGRCGEHGSVDGEFDLRIKGVLDDGKAAQDILLDAEAVEDLTGTGLEEAKQMAMDALDTEVVEQRFEDELVGQYYAVEGPQYGRYLLVDSMDLVGGRDGQRCEELLIEARSQVLDVADAGEELGTEGREVAEMEGETVPEAPA